MENRAEILSDIYRTYRGAAQDALEFMTSEDNLNRANMFLEGATSQDDNLGSSVAARAIESQPDWEQRHYEVARAIFFKQLDIYDASEAARAAKEAADEFINTMKGNEQ